jgi:hypothetical protein
LLTGTHELIPDGAGALLRLLLFLPHREPFAC